MDKVEKICPHHRKEYLKISKTAKFEVICWKKTNEDVAPQNREILETFVRGGGGRGAQTCPSKNKSL